MERVEKIIALAKDNIHRSVIEINPNLREEEKSKDKDYLTFGVKNTSDIPRELIENLRGNKKYLWTTIDRMAHLGRSIDTELTNPLTYRVMTGSSSGSPINIIKGINDFAIGTDGGGSVLAPALSCNLYSFLGTGIGLVVNKPGVSTDNISLIPGIGVIAKDFYTLKNVMKNIMPIYDPENKEEKIKIVIPAKDNATTADGLDMNKIILSLLKDVKNYGSLDIVEYEFKDINNRGDSVKDIKNIFRKAIGDVIISFEGPIDMLGYDETIQRMFNGKIEKELTSRGGKALVKSANICRCSAITIPTDVLAAGLLLCVPEGKENLWKLIKIAEEISEVIKRPEIFMKYFIRREKYVSQLDF